MKEDFVLCEMVFRHQFLDQFDRFCLAFQIQFGGRIRADFNCNAIRIAECHAVAYVVDRPIQRHDLSHLFVIHKEMASLVGLGHFHPLLDPFG